MNKQAKKRLCWNCEGNVTLDAETCPYCGVSVVPASLDNITTGYTPLYKQTEPHGGEIPRSPYTFNTLSPAASLNVDEAEAEEKTPTHLAEEPEIDYAEFKKTLFATVFLLTGSVFFMFGLALALFAHDGVLVLEWDGTLWFVYLILAAPLLFFGWRYLSHLDQDN